MVQLLAGAVIGVGAILAMDKKTRKRVKNEVVGFVADAEVYAKNYAQDVEDTMDKVQDSVSSFVNDVNKERAKRAK
jgi:hypothetical protein